MEEMNTIKLIDADSNEVIELEVVEDLTIDGNHYLILASLEDNDDAFIYKVVGEGEKAAYEAVEDEEEFNKVVAEYDRIFEEEMGK